MTTNPATIELSPVEADVLAELRTAADRKRTMTTDGIEEIATRLINLELAGFNGADRIYITEAGRQWLDLSEHADHVDEKPAGLNWRMYEQDPRIHIEDSNRFQINRTESHEYQLWHIAKSETIGLYPALSVAQRKAEEIRKKEDRPTAKRIGFAALTIGDVVEVRYDTGEVRVAVVEHVDADHLPMLTFLFDDPAPEHFHSWTQKEIENEAESLELVEDVSLLEDLQRIEDAKAALHRERCQLIKDAIETVMEVR